MEEDKRYQEEEELLPMHRRLSVSEQRKVEEVKLAAMFGSIIYNFTDAKGKVDANKQKTEVNLPRVVVEKEEVTKEKVHQSILDALDSEIPEDPNELRQSRLFQATKRLVEFQRDQYLVGKDYATQTAARRTNDIKKDQLVQSSMPNDESKVGSSLESSGLPTVTASKLASWVTMQRLGGSNEDGDTDSSFSNSRLPFDPTALGHQQVAKLVSSQLLPLPALRQATLPLFCQIPTLIYQPTQQSLINFILGQEDNLQGILKNSLLAFLNNPNNRMAIKTSTQGFILSSSPRLSIRTKPEPENSSF